MADNRPRRIGSLVLVIGLPALIVLAALWRFLPGDRSTAPATGAEDRRTVAIRGDVARFDPVAGLGQAAALAGPGARLEKLHAAGVRRDGTLDLTASYVPAPRATYSFYRSAPAPVPAPPPGAGGSVDGRWFQALRVDAYRPGQTRQVTRIGGGIGERYRYTNRGLDLEEGAVSGKAGSEVPPPACRFDQLWEDAIAQGAPADAVAQISYDGEGYRFNIPGIFHRRYGMDCRASR